MRVNYNECEEGNYPSLILVASSVAIPSIPSIPDAWDVGDVLLSQSRPAILDSQA
jgi:hypothetical protein